MTPEPTTNPLGIRMILDRLSFLNPDHTDFDEGKKLAKSQDQILQQTEPINPGQGESIKKNVWAQDPIPPQVRAE